MLKFIQLLIISFSVVVISTAQNIKIEKVNEKNYKQTYKMDPQPFLEKHEKIVTKFLTENPNYFDDLKLQKINAWNFSVGSAKNWYAYNFTDNFYTVPSTCRAIGTNCYIFVEDAIWNTKVNINNVNAIIDAFDNSTPANNNKGIYETVVESFGNPPDVDNDPKIIILILDIIDGYDGSGGYIAGYFHSINEIVGAYPNSNNAEIYYLDADPSDLSTAEGLNNVMNTTAHEFQHMIHFNYHNGSASKPEQTTFLNEGCSLASEVVCGYPIYNQSLFNNEYNHYLLDWRSEDDVLSDYSRAARYVTYLYEQFGVDFLRNFVQSNSFGIAGINDALINLSNPTSLRFAETLGNWFIANTLNDKNVNSSWGYVTPNVNKVNAVNYANPNKSSEVISVEKAAADYILFSAGRNLSIQFDDFGAGKLKFKALKYNINNEVEVQDIAPNNLYNFNSFGTIYNVISFVILNTDPFNTYNYSYTSTGESNSVTLAYDINPPTGVLDLSDEDTVCVVFDGVLGGTLDSIKVALRQAGSVYGGIYEYSGVQRPSPLGEILASDLTVTSNIAEKPQYNYETNSYPDPWPNWITVDLTSSNIDASNSFAAAFVVQGTYPEYNRIMTTEQPNVNNHSFTYFEPSSSPRDWYYVSSSDTTIYAYLIRAYVSFGVTDVDEQVIEILPKEFVVEQNYPNPFNPVTKIDFSIPKSSRVKLSVFNGMGELVKTILDQEISAGQHSKIFDGTNLSSGVYYYKLSAGDYFITRKMILMK